MIAPTAKEEALDPKPKAKKDSASLKIVNGPKCQDRKELCEGRNYGVGFAIARPEDNQVVLLMPISPCKDYLNDIVWSEHTGKSGENCGLKSSPQQAFDTGIACMVVAICHYQCGSNYQKYDKEIKYLDDNLDKLCEFIIFFERHINASKKGPIILTTAVKAETNRYVFYFDPIWVSAIYMISFYSMLIRMGVEGGWGERGPSDPMEFLKTCECTDRGRCNKSMVGKIDKILSGDIPTPSMHDISRPHGQGLMSADHWTNTKSESE